MSKQPTKEKTTSPKGEQEPRVQFSKEQLKEIQRFRDLKETEAYIAWAMGCEVEDLPPKQEGN